MSTMTAVRSTPNLSVPATQNTAPVFEFRCLYTQDLRKKRKVWHDGSLKFHTFNKRVMVWDEHKNYIGDVHWRQNEDLEEGTELSLDRGALVEVGERIGSTQTDLAPLREAVRQHPVNTESTIPPVTSRNNHPPSSRDWSAPRSQWQPKPLSAVLGASQGPIGRARLPTKSPFELQNQNRTMPSAEGQRPTKRARLAENPNNGFSNAPQPAGMVQHQARQPEGPSHGVRALTRGIDPRVNSSGQEEPVGCPLGNSHPAETLVIDRAPTNGHKTMSHAPRKAASSAPELQEPHQKNPNEGPKSLAGQAVEAARKTSHVRQTRNRIPNERQSTRLRFKKTASRRKIMYKDLLPSKAARRDVSPEIAQKDYYEIAKRRRNVNMNRRNSDLSSIFSSQPLPQVLRSSEHQLVRRISDGGVSPSREDPQASTIYIDSSPEEVRSPRSPTPPVRLQDHVDMAISPIPIVNRVQRAPSEVPRKASQNTHELINTEHDHQQQDNPQNTHRHHDEIGSGQLNTGPRENNSHEILYEGSPCPDPATPAKGSVLATTLERASPVASKLAMVDEQIVARTPVTAQMHQMSPVIERTPQPRPFRKVLSVNDSPEMVRNDENPVRNVPGQSVQQAPLPLGEHASNAQPRHKSPVKLRKSKSLSEVIEKTSAKAQEGLDLPAISEEQENDEKGPWTAHEAWDLFAWWPEGREKPNFTVPEDRINDSDEICSAAAFTPGFISAIDAL